MTQYTRFGIEEDAMPEAPSDIDYTVDIGRHETMFRANTPKGDEFLRGVDLITSNEEAHASARPSSCWSWLSVSAARLKSGK